MHDPRTTPARHAAPQALLIDGMGTLVALAAPASALRHELASRFGVEVSLQEAGGALRAEITYYRAHMDLGRDTESLSGLRRRCADVLRGALPPSDRLAAVDIDALTEALLAALRFEAYADARPALLRARDAGARVVVVSNWDVSLVEVLERLGLAPLLHGVVTSAAIGAPKPAPAIFRHALTLAGAEPQDALHIGDSVEEDVRGAAACGIRPLLLRRDGDDGPGDAGDVATIRSLAELQWRP